MPIRKNFYINLPVAGQIAQLVEQRTENPRVGGSIPSLTTIFLEGGYSPFFVFKSGAMEEEPVRAASRYLCKRHVLPFQRTVVAGAARTDRSEAAPAAGSAYGRKTFFYFS